MLLILASCAIGVSAIGFCIGYALGHATGHRHGYDHWGQKWHQLTDLAKRQARTLEKLKQPGAQ